MITDDESKELKTWVIKKLEDISDADSDVLADYVLALIRADTPEPELRTNAIMNLDDFLKDNTASFVDEVFLAIHTKSYIPGYLAPPLPTLPTPSFSASVGSNGAYGDVGARDGDGYNEGFQPSRKRSYNDIQGGKGGHDAHYGRGDRQTKQMRRGHMNNGRGGAFQGRMDFQPPGSLPGLSSAQVPSVSQIMQPPAGSGMPFDLNDPVAVMLTMQALGFPGMPTMPQSPPAIPQARNSNWQISPKPPTNNRINARCRDYDTKGFCARGNACPFDHGDNQIVVPPQQDEYDPKKSNLMDFSKTSSSTNGHTPFEAQRAFTNGRGHGQGRGDRGGYVPQRKNRADFSQAGPNHDRSITTVVVEQIPEENFDEQSVRGFFSEFGAIEDVQMQAYKRLAIVRYSDYSAAKRAYESPKVIFDNRFVKVYWFNPNSIPTPSRNGSLAKASSPISATKLEEPTFDKEKFERESLAAQRKLEERKALMKEAEAKRQELEKQKEDLARKQAEEKRKLMEKLKAKGQPTDQKSSNTIDHATTESNGITNPKASAQTEILRATLAALEEEAKSLGIDPATVGDPPSFRGRGRGRGRGSYRGWEGFAGTGRGGAYEPSRAGSRGRGTFRGARGAGAYNLDNRTKKVKVSGVEFNNDKDELLRQYLLGLGEFEALEPSDPALPRDAQIITFKDRFVAERFIYGPKEIPSIGRLEFAWVHTPLLPVVQPSSRQEGVESVDMDMGGTGADGDNRADLSGQQGSGEVDYDVAEDDDRWMVS
ncbi:MAG: hypothetical protein Q9187_002379 [Circinaria calcarea]